MVQHSHSNAAVPLESEDEATAHEADNDNAGRAARPAHIADLPNHEVTRRCAAIKGTIAQLRATLPGLVRLTDAQRANPKNHLRDGEEEAVTATLKTARERPELCKGIQGQGLGAAPCFDAARTLDVYDHVEELNEVAKVAHEFAQLCEDTALAITGQVREPASRAYRVLRAVAEFDLSVQTTLKPALDYYGGIGRKAARTRAEATNDEPPEAPTKPVDG